MSRTLLAALAGLALGCGGLPGDVGGVVGPEDTAAGLLAKWGPPCDEGPYPGGETWIYCAAWSRAEGRWGRSTVCTPGCSPVWRVHVISGYVVGAESP